MADIQWATDVSGDFSQGSNWVGGAVPALSDNAILDAAGGKPYVVTVDNIHQSSVGSIHTAANAKLVVPTTGGVAAQFEAIDGTGNGANAGTIFMSGSTNLTIGGTFDNAGSLIFHSSNQLLLFTANVTLTGSGLVTFDDGVIQRSNGQQGQLTNVGNRIFFEGDDNPVGLLTLNNEAGGLISCLGSAPADLIISTDSSTLVSGPAPARVRRAAD